MSSSESDDFDAFLESLRPTKQDNKYRLSSGSLDEFVVGDEHVSFCEDASSGSSHEQDSYLKDVTCGKIAVQNGDPSSRIPSLMKNQIYSHSSSGFSHDEDSDTKNVRHITSVQNGTLREEASSRKISSSIGKDPACEDASDFSHDEDFSVDDGMLETKILQGAGSSMEASSKTASSSTDNQDPSQDASSDFSHNEDSNAKGVDPLIDRVQNSLSSLHLSSRKSSSSDHEEVFGRRSKPGAKSNPGLLKSKNLTELRNRGSFTPKRSTASSISKPKLSQKNSVATPKIIFSSDGDDDDDVFKSVQPESQPDPELPSKENTAPLVPKGVRRTVGNSTPVRKPPLHSGSSARKSSKILVFSDESDSDSDNDVVYLGEMPGVHDRQVADSLVDDCIASLPNSDEDDVSYTPLVSRVKKKPENPVLTDLKNIKKDRKTTPRTSLPDMKTPFKKPPKVFFSEKPAKTRPVIKQRSDGLPPNLPPGCEKGTGFRKHRETVTKTLYNHFNDTIFENRLPADMVVEWNKRLLKTAGVTKCSSRLTTTYESGIKCTSRTYKASIDLSEKVLDTLHRLRDTLCHEMCHAAVWLLDHQNEGHGIFWKSWARKATAAHPEMPVVKRCHSYDISYKYSYQCVVCRKVYGRHSKSIKLDKQACGVCRGRLVLLPPTKGDGTPLKSRQPNKFALFVKENYKSVQESNSVGYMTPKHADIMKTLSEKFAALSAKK